MTIRDRIQQIGGFMQGDPPPHEIRAYEVALAGLLAATNRALTGAHLAFNRKFAEMRSAHDSHADAKTYAEATEEFADYLEAKSAKESCVEMLRTCRSVGRSQAEELRAR